MARPKITRRISADEAALLLQVLQEEAIRAHDLPFVDVSPDPDDNRILATAIAGEADLIVSGDHAGRFDLREVSGILIIRAREALERLALIEE